MIPRSTRTECSHPCMGCKKFGHSEPVNECNPNPAGILIMETVEGFKNSQKRLQRFTAFFPIFQYFEQNGQNPSADQIFQALPSVEPGCRDVI